MRVRIGDVTANLFGAELNGRVLADRLGAGDVAIDCHRNEEQLNLARQEARQLRDAGERAVAANGDDDLDATLDEIPRRRSLPIFVSELGIALGAKRRAASMQQRLTVDNARYERNEVIDVFVVHQDAKVVIVSRHERLEAGRSDSASTSKLLEILHQISEHRIVTGRTTAILHQQNVDVAINGGARQQRVHARRDRFEQNNAQRWR